MASAEGGHTGAGSSAGAAAPRVVPFRHVMLSTEDVPMDVYTLLSMVTGVMVVVFKVS